MSELWRELHLNALHYEGTDDSAFLTNFGRRIPRYTRGCLCREHWMIWNRQNPPTYTPAGAYFEWTVKAHNNVNIKLGKPQMDIEDARKLYTETV